VAAALAVLAAIAAADALCSLKLHRYSRGQDHAQAVALLETVDVDDPSLPGKMRRIFAPCRAARFADCRSSRLTVSDADVCCERRRRRIRRPLVRCNRHWREKSLCITPTSGLRISCQGLGATGSGLVVAADRLWRRSLQQSTSGLQWPSPQLYLHQGRGRHDHSQVSLAVRRLKGLRRRRCNVRDHFET
jgi:hypothetical protein